MSISYKSIVPWGRSFLEYRDMFGLTTKDLNKKILGCGDGPASFNVQMKHMGKSVTSFNPVYAFTKEQLLERIEESNPI